MKKKISQVVHEADATVRESRETGAPIDEVFELRAERRAEHVAASQPVVDDYNEAAARLRERGTAEDRLAVWAAMGDLNRLSTGRRVDRRRFLKGAGAAAAGLAALSLGGSTVLRPAPANAATSVPRIAIIGGGLAGLRTAHKLWIDRGIKSTIYEADDRIGGRVDTERSFFLNGQIAEKHAEFVNTEHLAVKALAARYGVEVEDLWIYPQGTDDTYWINNSRYTAWEVTQDWKAFGYKAFHDAVLLAEAPQTFDNHNPQAVAWDNQDVPTWLTQNLPGGSSTRLYKLALESLAGEWGNPADVSGLGMLWQWAYNSSKKTAHSYQSKSYLWVEGGDARWHLKGGSDQLATGMAGELPAGTIKPNSPVLGVVKNSDGTYNLSVKTGNKTTSVTVDHVVIAAPFSSLRANVSLSKAGLSPLKMTAIQKLGMSTAGKVILQFNGHPWFANSDGNANFDGNCLADSPTNWWYEPNYQTNNNTAPTGLLVNYTVDGVTESYISKYRLKEDEGVAPSGLVNELLAPIDTYFGPGVKAAYNGKAFYHFGLINQWYAGAYPYWPVGGFTGFSGIEGRREGNIHFAGDHDWDFPGYMEGALLSGERCAAEI
ncbi:MAG: NAD(P)/FAD-dependent oxidoreductase [Actinomycetota bacterium]